MRKARIKGGNTMEGRGNWGSKIGFILAASGSAVGLGNIWRFPYTTGKNGGALFVLVYIIAVVVVALPVLIAEVTLGRFTGKNPVGAYQALSPEKKKIAGSGNFFDRLTTALFQWKYVGYLGVLTGFAILSYYAVIAGWTVGYFIKSVTGEMAKITTGNTEQIYSSFTSNTILQIALLGFFIFMTAYVVSRGVSSGIEKFSKILRPMLFGLMLLLLIRALTLSNAAAGLKFYLQPKFSDLSPRVIIEALGQAFFSMSLGMGTMITYGSYVNKRENIPTSTAWIAFFDTFIAFLAGLIIFPAIFHAHMNPAGGPGLVFKILPVIFAKMPLGYISGPLFFVLLAIAALTSTISVLEVPVSFAIDERKWSRKKAAWIIAFITFLVGIPSALSEKFLDLMNFIWGNISLSIGALMVSVFVAYVWKTSKALMEISRGTEKFKFAAFWLVSIKYITPASIIVILIGIIVLGITF
jgi:NSS family neurotransmitter:Na+ symporter